MPAPLVAAAARSGAGKAATGKAAGGKAAAAARPPAAGRNLAGVTDTATVTDELQRRRREAAAPKPAPAGQSSSPASPVQAIKSAPGNPLNAPRIKAPAALTDNRGAPSWWARPGDGIRAANAGGGFALGLVTYVVVLTYLRDGRDGVKALLKAKFFNEVPA